MSKCLATLRTIRVVKTHCNAVWQDVRWRFASLAGQTRGKYRDGTIQAAAARHANGQWVVPTKVELFTERGGRRVTLSLHDATEVMSFLLPLPAPIGLILHLLEPKRGPMAPTTQLRPNCYPIATLATSPAILTSSILVRNGCGNCDTDA